MQSSKPFITMPKGRFPGFGHLSGEGLSSPTGSKSLGPNLITDLENGIRYVIGQRVEYMAGTFDISGTLRLVSLNGDTYLTSTADNVMKDHLPGVQVL